MCHNLYSWWVQESPTIIVDIDVVAVDTVIADVVVAIDFVAIFVDDVAVFVAAVAIAVVLAVAVEIVLMYNPGEYGICYGAQAGFRQSCFYFPSSGVPGAYYHVWSHFGFYLHFSNWLN